MWEGLKGFFLEEENTSKAITDFFKYPLSELYTVFIHSKMFLIENQKKKTKKYLMERSTTEYLGFHRKKHNSMRF